MRTNRFWLALCGAILILGIVGCFWAMRPTGGRMVQILQEGDLLYTLDLSSAEDEVFSVETDMASTGFSSRTVRSVCCRRTARIRPVFKWAPSPKLVFPLCACPTGW